MPTSDSHNLSLIAALLQRLQPGSVLDIGCGFGKYGVVAREYLDVWHGRVARDTWQTRIEAIEVFEAYRSPAWDVYDRVHLGPARDIVPTLAPFEVVLIVDVIEHLEIADARALVSTLLDSGATVVISTPVDFWPQTAEHGNPYEIHRCRFTIRDFSETAHVRSYPALACTVFVASRDPLPVLYPVSAIDTLYLRARRRLRLLGRFGWPVAAFARALNRRLA